jgi:hypothetical protein
MAEEEVLIALPTVRRPTSDEAGQSLIAVAVFTRERAAEILRRMEYVAEQASQAESWLGVFKLCAFDKNTFYVPAEYVRPLPEGNDFIVLDPEYTFPGMVQLVRLQVNILPGAVTWEAHDPVDRFTVETPEMSADVLRAIAIGGVLEPGSTMNAASFVLPAEPLFDNSPGLEKYTM